MTEWIKSKMQQYPAYKRLSLASKTWADNEGIKKGMSSNGNNIKVGLAMPLSDFKLLMVKNTKQVII